MKAMFNIKYRGHLGMTGLSVASEPAASPLLTVVLPLSLHSQEKGDWLLKQLRCRVQNVLFHQVFG